MSGCAPHAAATVLIPPRPNALASAPSSNRHARSSFLRAGLIPRLQRDDRHFRVLGIVRPERNALTGEHGLAAAIHTARQALHLRGAPLGEIKTACLNDPDRVVELLGEVRTAAAEQLADAGRDGTAPSMVLPLDQAEELFSADRRPTSRAVLGPDRRSDAPAQ